MRTPIMRLAVHLDSASEMSDPPKPKMAANTSKPPVPPCAKCTPNTFSTMNRTRLSSASTAKLVSTNRKMRFIWGAFDREKEPQYGYGSEDMVGTSGFNFKTRIRAPRRAGFAIDRPADRRVLTICYI